MSAARYGWYGDDFTGASDTLATLAERNLAALLFLKVPTASQLERAGPLDAIGIAGAARSMAPEAMTAELEAVGRFFAAAGVQILHYKCCSTFDSAPHVGSIGVATRALAPHFPNPFVPILGGQPNLGRFCLFGTLFAAAGDGQIHRIDRHPTMSIHPVTPMAEADLRRHLALQGLADLRLVDYRAYGSPLDIPSAPTLLDVSRAEDLSVIGPLLWAKAGAGPMLAVGASSVAQALATAWTDRRASQQHQKPPRHDGPVLALVGSLSPVTRAQVEAAQGYRHLAIDPHRLLQDPDYVPALQRQVVDALGLGNVMLVTDPPGATPVNAGALASATGQLLGNILKKARISRLLIAGGDTSSLAVRSLDMWGLSYIAPLVPGAPLCRAHSDDPSLDGLEITLKGGQMGPTDFFTLAAR
ncbi:four-carbon acid sugar kinase family protein [Lacibacterium aquatile]|uniref:Four-carbon acid sugar kinase family protein n=1 Tax=Lacibacterium aquatile TaxID=1168082 RepID=A0ABW5DTR6_9PROT